MNTAGPPMIRMSTTGSMTHPLRTSTAFSRLTEAISVFMDCLSFVLRNVVERYHYDIIMLSHTSARRKCKKNAGGPAANAKERPGRAPFRCGRSISQLFTSQTVLRTAPEPPRSLAVSDLVSQRGYCGEAPARFWRGYRAIIERVEGTLSHPFHREQCRASLSSLTYCKTITCVDFDGKLALSSRTAIPSRPGVAPLAAETQAAARGDLLGLPFVQYELVSVGIAHHGEAAHRRVHRVHVHRHAFGLQA